MTQQLKTKQEKFLFSILVTFIWGMIAHGYRFFNLDFSHDSLLVFQELDYAPMLSVGRFLQPVYFLLRGNTYPPALVGVLSLLFIGVSVYLTAELLHRETKLSVIMLGGIMTVNAVITLTSATYIHDLDIYTLALLLAVWSTVICRKGRFGFLLAVIPAICSMGIYQSYIQTAILLHMILAILGILHGEDTKKVFQDGLRAVASVAISLLVYFALYRIVLSVTAVGESTNYNSIANVGSAEGISAVLHDIAYSAYSVFRYFANPLSAHSRTIAVVNGVIIALAAFRVAQTVLTKKIRGWALALLAALFVLMPFAMNVICFLSGGMVHHVMLYACVMLYVFAAECDGLWEKASCLSRRLMPLLLAIVILDGVVYSNQVYLKKSLEDNATSAVMNRILDRIEQTEGYEYGETPVAFMGLLYESPLTRQAEDFDYTGTGLWHSFAVSFPESYGMYIHHVLNYDMEILPPEECDVLSQREDVQEMGIFPAKDSVQLVDGVIVVKLSESMLEN